MLNLTPKKNSPANSARMALTGWVALLLSVHHLAAEESITHELEPFFQKHCISCHGPEKERGDLRVDLLSDSLDDFESLEHFQYILDEVTLDAMPPEEEPRPSPQELAKAIPLLTEHLKKATQKHSSGGGRPVRRLTKIEYRNTVADLLGVHLNAESLPDDGAIGVFDTEAQALYTTDMYLENYMVEAHDVARRFIASRSEKPGEKEVSSQQPPKKGNKFVLQTKELPSAGYLKARFQCWIEAPQSQPIYTGPANSLTHEVTGSPSKAQQIERTFYHPGNETWIIAPGMGLGKIQYFTVTNPQPYEFFQAFLGKYPQSNPPDSAATQLIEQFVTLMNRGRKIDRILLDGLKQQFLAARKRDEPFWQAMEGPMALAMSTIEAMFHFEDKDPQRNTRHVSTVELSNRLSYFLWRSAPDRELLKIAQSGKIYDAKIRSQQIERMMNDEKFERFLRDFSTQWLELERQDLIAVNSQLFRDFDNSIKGSIKEETIQFMAHIIKNNLPLENLIDSDFLLLNATMAKHYDLAQVQGDHFRVVPLPPKSRRGGLLTQAGILMQTGNGDRTSIVERGVFLAKKMLNAEPPPPPPLVDDLPVDGQDFKQMTGAELVRKHASSVQCASCHKQIDPLGIGLEEFDAIGLYRSKDVRINPDFAKQPKRARRSLKNLTFEVELETEGQIFTGQKFQGSEGLKKALLQNQHRLAQSYIQALLTFANGRKAGITEKETVDNLVQRASKARYPARAILKVVAESMGTKANQ